jgi:hypothetical protein
MKRNEKKKQTNGQGTRIQVNTTKRLRRMVNRREIDKCVKKKWTNVYKSKKWTHEQTIQKDRKQLKFKNREKHKTIIINERILTKKTRERERERKDRKVGIIINIREA